MDDLVQQAKSKLVTTLPRDLPLWHWTRSAMAVRQIRDLIEAGGSLESCGRGATGRGLYLSASATDLMDHGAHLLAVVIPAGTPVLMVHPEVFQVGFPELMEPALASLGWAWALPPAEALPRAPGPAPDVLNALLDRLELPACVYVLGLHLAAMAVQGRGLRLVPEAEQLDTVRAWVRTHPRDAPMLFSPEARARWQALRGTAT